MKNLFYPVLFLFLFSSSAVYARTAITPMLEIKEGCIKELEDLQRIANSAKDIELVTKGCIKGKMQYQWKVKYLLTPTQKFSFAEPANIEARCLTLAYRLNTEFSNDKVRFHARCVEKKSTKFAGVGDTTVHRTGYLNPLPNRSENLTFFWKDEETSVLEGKIEILTKSYAKKFKTSHYRKLASFDRPAEGR